MLTLPPASANLIFHTPHFLVMNGAMPPCLSLVYWSVLVSIHYMYRDISTLVVDVWCSFNIVSESQAVASVYKVSP